MIETALDNKNFIQRAPYEAVADAVMAVQAFYLLPRLSILARRRAQTNTPVDIDSIHDLLYEETRHVCKYASRVVLENLYAQHPWLFRYFLLLRSEQNFLRPFKPDPTWNFHYYFLVQDVNGVWHAGSPANYPKDPASLGHQGNPLTQIFHSRSLTEIVDLISATNGGFWPSAKKIDGCISGKNTIRPHKINVGRYSQEMKFAVIRKDADGAVRVVIE